MYTKCGYNGVSPTFYRLSMNWSDGSGQNLPNIQYFAPFFHYVSKHTERCSRISPLFTFRLSRACHLLAILKFAPHLNRNQVFLSSISPNCKRLRSIFFINIIAYSVSTTLFHTLLIWHEQIDIWCVWWADKYHAIVNEFGANIIVFVFTHSIWKFRCVKWILLRELCKWFYLLKSIEKQGEE